MVPNNSEWGWVSGLPIGSVAATESEMGSNVNTLFSSDPSTGIVYISGEKGLTRLVVMELYLMYGHSTSPLQLILDTQEI